MMEGILSFHSKQKIAALPHSTLRCKASPSAASAVPRDGVYEGEVIAKDKSQRGLTRRPAFAFSPM